MEENKKRDEKPAQISEEQELKEDVVQTEHTEDISVSEQQDKRYKTLVTLDKNLWTYGSPIIFENGILERDMVSNKNRLTLSFTNINQLTINNVNITVFASDDEGNMEQIEHQYAALGQKYMASKGASAKIHVQNEDAEQFVIQVNSVEFEDGTVWSKEEAFYESAGEIEDIQFFAEAKAKDYEDSYIQGKENVSKDDSASIGDGIEILKRVVWYKDTKEILKDSKRKYRIAQQNEERKRASEDRRSERKTAVKKRYITAGITIGMIALITVVSVVAFFIPNGKYKEAKKYINAKQYDKAAASFEKLNGFLKSESYLAQAYYNLGLQALSGGDEKKASDCFTKGHDADAESDYGKMSGSFLDYYAGSEALEKKDYDKAMQLLKSSANAASDFNLTNKASASMAQIYYLQGKYENAWNAIKNVYAKDASYQAQYGEYGYGYAKSLVDSGKTKEGMDIYNTISKYTKAADLNQSVYNQAVKLGEQGKIADSMKLLDTIKKSYKPAAKLYEEMYQFNDKVQYWLGVWKHKGIVNGEKTTYRITISALLYKGEMCLRIIDKNNKYLGFDTVISAKNRVTQIVIGTYQLHFKLKKFHDQKFTYTLKGGKKMIRELKYDGKKYSSKYKK